MDKWTIEHLHKHLSILVVFCFAVSVLCLFSECHSKMDGTQWRFIFRDNNHDGRMNAFVARRQLKKMRWENGRHYVTVEVFASQMFHFQYFGFSIGSIDHLNGDSFASYLLYHSWMKKDGNGWATIWLNIKTEYSLLFSFRFKYHSVINSRIQIDWCEWAP